MTQTEYELENKRQCGSYLAEIDRLKAELEKQQSLWPKFEQKYEDLERQLADAAETERFKHMAEQNSTETCEWMEKCNEARAEVERYNEEYQSACTTIAEMHRAAVGEITGPKRGVVEDVYDAVKQARREGWEQGKRQAVRLSYLEGSAQCSDCSDIHRKITAMEYGESK